MAQITFKVSTTSSTLVPAIPVNVQVHAEARGLGDLWNDSTNADARRKVQNRLNQRAFRRRKAVEKASKVQVFELRPAPQPPTPSSEPSPTLPEKSTELEATVHRDDFDQKPLPSLHPTTIVLPLRETSWCRPYELYLKSQPDKVTLPADVEAESESSTIVQFEESFLQNLKPSDLYRLPADDELLSLMYYNVFRALTANVRMLGLDTVLMHTDEYPSPFITGAVNLRNVPPHLQPTLLQRTQPHHPCFDIFPDPIVRDHGIRNAHFLPHGTLCMTLAGRNTWFENERSRRSGLVIWGPPEDANSWEVTEGFVACWGWLVKGSVMLQYSTNRWRAVRGEPAIFFA